jgi:hypothetical protein
MRKQRLRKQQSARRRDQRASAALGAIDERAPEEGDAARRAPLPEESETTCVVSIGAPAAARLANAAAPTTMLRRVVSRERAASEASDASSARERGASSERDAKARRDPRLAFRSLLRVASGEEPDATLGALNDALPGGAIHSTPKPAAVLNPPGSGSWTPAFARNRAARSGEGVAALEIRRGVAFCGREDGVIAVRPFFPDERKKNPADEKKRSPPSTPYAAADVHQDVHPPSEWNGAAGAVRFLRAFPAEEEEGARRREGNASENTSSLFAAYDNGSWARFVPDPLDGWVVSSCAPGPHPDFADVFKLRPARERSRWANRRAKIGAACLDAAGRELFLASPVLGESCVYRWILPSATTALAPRSLAGKKKDTRGGDGDGDGDGGGGGVVAPEDALAGPPSAAASEASASPSPPRRRRESWETLKASTWGDVQRLERHTDAVMCLAPLPGGGFASGGNDARLVAWRPSAEVSEGGGGGGGGGERGGERGGSFVSGGVRVVRETTSGGAIRALAISPDATRWFTAGSEGNVRAWDASDLEGRGFVLLRAFRGGHQGFVTSLAIVPPPRGPESDADANAKRAARYVVSGSEGSPGGYWSKGDGAVKVWRVGDGACVCTTPAKQSGDVVAVRPVASRSVLACAASDGTVAEWDVLWPKRRGAGSAEGDDDITWERGFLR